MRQRIDEVARMLGGVEITGNHTPGKCWARMMRPGEMLGF
jgi:hypothetical protein